MVEQSRGPATGKPGGKVTIHDVARSAEVSIKTVSRVLNAEPGVKTETRDRVLGVISELGYQPHSGARSMRGRPKNRVGLTLAAPPSVVPLSEQLLHWMFEEIYNVLGLTGNYLCLDLNPFAQNGNTDYARGLWEQLFGGVIVTGPLKTGDKIIERIHRSGFPYVAIGRLDSFPNCSSATVDFEEATYMSTKFLIDRGHHRIALLKSFEGFQPGVERRRGYLHALEEAGIEPDEDLIGTAGFVSDRISGAVCELLSRKDVTALLDCSGSEDGESIRRGAAQAGRRIAQDLEVVTWTYTNRAAVLEEAVAHVWIPILEAAQEGIRLFGDWFAGVGEGPIKVLHQAILYEDLEPGEVPKPRPFFAMTE